MKLKTISAAWLGLMILLCALNAPGREGTPPASRRLPVRPLQDVPQLDVASTDQAALLTADGPIPATPLRFAAPVEVMVTPLTHGLWETVAGGRVWRLRVRSAGASDLNFGFTTCWLPDGATLHVYAEGEDYVQGPYEAGDNQPHGQLWTPVLPGGQAVIELFVPDTAREQPQLLLARVNRGYRDMFGRRKQNTAKLHGECNVDVICPIGDPWRQEIRSVARYTRNGNVLCTGTLVNDATGTTNKNYFLTAFHCGVTAGTAPTLVVYWNYQSPVCGQQGGGSLAQNQSGATFRAGRADVDMTLVELNATPSAAFRVYYSGWDRSGTAPTGAVGIHHPRGDVKSISISSNTLATVDSCIDTDGVESHWGVVWSVGTTEPGSSGSALWNADTHRLVGFLSGGGASCETPLSQDCYGKFSVAWDGDSADTRLRDWLDPLGSGVTVVPPRDPFPAPLVLPVAALLTNESCFPTNRVADPGEQITFSFSLRNIGGTNTATVIATLLATNGVLSPGAAQNYGVLNSNGTPVSREFTFTASGSCGGVISPTLQIQDGSSNRGNVSFSMSLGAARGLVQNFDGVTAPALPGGWINSASGGSTGWETTTSDFHTSPNSALTFDPDALSDSSLESPLIPIVTATAKLSFAHWYTTEPDFDGCVLEISVNNGAYADILDAGGSFVAGGYNGNIDSSFGNPLEDGREVWTGDSFGFITTVVNLPAAVAGQNIRLRWRLASDLSEGSYGWNLDTITVTDGYVCCQGLVTPTIIETRRMNNNIVFSFNTSPGQSYVTEFKGALSTNLAWTPLQTNAGDGTKKSVTNSTATATNRFFRVKTQ